MNILCVDFRWKSAMESMGHRVAAPQLPFGICDLPELLASLRKQENFQPDLIIQQERLSERVLLQGLEQAPCPTVFVSVDTHLNLFWQKYYARLFDFVFTPHLSLFANLPPEESLGSGTLRLRHAGLARHWQDYASRPQGLAFCGVVNQHRPLRQALLELLQKRFTLSCPKETLPFAKMLDFFSDSRLVPNESISAEVNFRLFEAASCGCLVLSQNLGEDQDVCFEPGREVVVYNHALELLDKARFYLEHPAEAEAMARRAWARVHAEHLPEHRCAELLSMVAASYGATHGRARGLAAEKYFLLTLTQLFRHGSHKLNTTWMLGRLTRLLDAGQDQEIAAALLALLSEAGQAVSPVYRPVAAQSYAETGLDLCRQLVEMASTSAVNLAASMFCLSNGELELVRRFWKKQQELLPSMPIWENWQKNQANYTATGASNIPLGFENGVALAVHWAEQPPHNPYDFYIYWSQVLTLQGKLARPGYRFRPEPGFMPENALECLLLADNEITDRTPVNSEWVALSGRMHEVCSRFPGYAWMDMGFLAQMSLYDQRNWHLQMQYGLKALQCLRLETGIGELAEAMDKAGQNHRLGDFTALLARVPAYEYIQRILELER